MSEFAGGGGINRLVMATIAPALHSVTKMKVTTLKAGRCITCIMSLPLLSDHAAYSRREIKEAQVHLTPMAITLEEVRHVAKLARLDLDEGEIVYFQSELNALIGHFSDIQKVDVAGIVPTSHAVAMQNVWAEDIAEEGLPRVTALRNAALHRAGLFVVPQIIED